MFCLATPLFRRGRKAPTTQHPKMTKGGRFRLVETFDQESRRTLRVARLLPLTKTDKGFDNDELPPLWDATVIYASGGSYWTVTGIEREVIDGTEVSLRQTWALRELPPEVCEELQHDVASGREGRIPLMMWGETGVPPAAPEPINPRDHGAHNLLPSAEHDKRRAP